MNVRQKEPYFSLAQVSLRSPKLHHYSRILDPKWQSGLLLNLGLRPSWCRKTGDLGSHTGITYENLQLSSCGEYLKWQLVHLSLWPIVWPRQTATLVGFHIYCLSISSKKHLTPKTSCANCVHFLLRQIPLSRTNCFTPVDCFTTAGSHCFAVCISCGEKFYLSRLMNLIFRYKPEFEVTTDTGGWVWTCHMYCTMCWQIFNSLWSTAVNKPHSATSHVLPRCPKKMR